MKNISIPSDENVLVGSEGKDDAGVYLLPDGTAIVQTLDFITPVCDDPFMFGRIAACNSLSDVYAMGGVPLTAMNILAFPTKKFSLNIMQDILEGGLSVLREASVQLLGGHSIDDEELKYGMSVTGTVDRDKILKNSTIREGDAIVLTKALGTGIIATAVKADFADEKTVSEFVETMATLNKSAAEVMRGFDVSACTDVTGFGLAGHLLEMIGDERLSVEIYSSSLPVLSGTIEHAQMGLLPAGLYRNRDYVGSRFTSAPGVARDIEDLVFDPQTSGGLLIALPEDQAKKLVSDLRKVGLHKADVVGRVVRKNTSEIVLV